MRQEGESRKKELITGRLARQSRESSPFVSLRLERGPATPPQSTLRSREPLPLGSLGDQPQTATMPGPDSILKRLKVMTVNIPNTEKPGFTCGYPNTQRFSA